MTCLRIYIIIIFSILTSCSSKTIVNNSPISEGSWVIERDIRKNRAYEKTGTFIYPNLKTRYTMKRGKFNGVFEIFGEKNDTLFYCTYTNNLPVGRYVLKEWDNNDKLLNSRSIPIKPKLEYGIGSGVFNKEHKKDGVWNEIGGVFIYKNGDITDTLHVAKY